jgi:hypothetical protein
MKRIHWLTNLIVAILMMGGIIFTASDYAGCKNLDQDEFLDLALASQIPLLPILTLHGKTSPRLPHFLGTVYFVGPNLCNKCLRC